MTQVTQSWSGVSEVGCEVDVGGMWHLLSRHWCIHITKRVEVDGGVDGDTCALRCRQRIFRAQQTFRA